MTYLTFLLLFLVPPILWLGLTQRRPLAGVGGRRARYTLPLICTIAFLYTTPWDNYLVHQGIWWYGQERVLGTLGYVPYEEYAFFLLQPLLTGLLLYRLLALPGGATGKISVGSRYLGLGFFLAITGIGVLLLVTGWARARYLGLILAWAAPVLAGLWAYAGDLFGRYRRPALYAVALPTLYLWVADRIALGLGIWSISDAHSLGFDPLGLPIEEALFFLLTNVMVVYGSLLFLFGDRLPRREHGPKPAATTGMPARSEA